MLPNKEVVVNTTTDSIAHMIHLNSVMTSYPIIVLSSSGSKTDLHVTFVCTQYFVRNVAHLRVEQTVRCHGNAGFLSSSLFCVAVSRVLQLLDLSVSTT